MKASNSRVSRSTSVKDEVAVLYNTCGMAKRDGEGEQDSDSSDEPHRVYMSGDPWPINKAWHRWRS